MNNSPLVWMVHSRHSVGRQYSCGITPRMGHGWSLHIEKVNCVRCRELLPGTWEYIEAAIERDTK